MIHFFFSSSKKKEEEEYTLSIYVVLLCVYVRFAHEPIALLHLSWLTAQM